MSVVNLASASYHVATAGAGAPLTLLHGFTGCAQSWQEHQPVLASRFRMIMPDLLGHGKSDAPADPARYRMDRCVADLLAMLDALEVERTHLLGYSMGGRVALAAAIRYPGRIASLILESASPGLAEPGERRARTLSDNAMAELIEREGIEAFVAQWERMPLFASQARLPETVRIRLRAQRLTNNSKGLANSLRGLGTGVQEPLWPRLSEIGMPCLIMAGELDGKFVAIGRAMAAAISPALLAIVPAAGHAIHLEQPAAFQRLVLDFVDGATR